MELVRDKVTTKLLALDPALGLDAVPLLLSVLDVPTNDADWRASPSRTASPSAGWRPSGISYCGEARRQPIVLIFEDLHWIDLETQAFLDGLVEAPQLSRTLLLLTYRPEYEHAWRWQGLLRPDPPGCPSCRWCDSASGRSAGRRSQSAFAEAAPDNGAGSLLSGRDRPDTRLRQKVLDGPRGDYRLMRPVETIDVPATVQIILAARIDRLTIEDKRLLQVAAASSAVRCLSRS